MLPADEADKHPEPSKMDLFTKMRGFGLRLPARNVKETPQSPPPCTPPRRPLSRHARSQSEPFSPAQLEILQYRQQAQLLPPLSTDSECSTPPSSTTCVPPSTQDDCAADESSKPRGLKQIRSFSLLRRRKSKTPEPSTEELLADGDGSPSKHSSHSTPTRSLLGRRSRKKSGKNLLRHSVQPPEPQYPVPPLPAQYRRQNVHSIMALQAANESRMTVVYDDRESARLGSTESALSSAHSLRPPPPARPATDTSPRTNTPPSEVALEFGATPSPHNVRVLADAETPKQHRRTQSADVRSGADLFTGFYGTSAPGQLNENIIRSHSYGAFADLGSPSKGRAISPTVAPAPLLPRVMLPETPKRQTMTRPFPCPGSHGSFGSFEEVLDVTPTKAATSLRVTQQEAAEPESTIFPDLSEAVPSDDHSPTKHDPSAPRSNSSASELDTCSQRNSIASEYSDKSRGWSPERIDAPPREWPSFDEDDFVPVDGSFGGGHNNPYAGISLSTIIEADTPATSYRYSQGSAMMLHHSRGGSLSASESHNTILPRRVTPGNETLALLEAQKAESSAVKNELAACKLVIEHLKREQERVATQVEEKDSKLRELGSKVNELEDDLDDARMALTAKEDSLNRLHDTHEQLLEEHRTSRQKRETSAALEGSSPANISDIDRQHADALDSLRAELLKEHDAALSDLRGQLAERDAQLQRTSFQTSDWELKIAALNARVEAASFEASEAKLARTTLENEKAALEEQVDQLRSDNAALTEDLDQAADDRDAVIDERDRALEERAEALDLLEEFGLHEDEKADHGTDGNHSTSRQRSVHEKERDVVFEVRRLVDSHQDLVDRHNELCDKYEKTSEECVELRQRTWHAEEVAVKRLEDRVATLTDLLQAANSRNDAAEDELVNRSANTLVLQEQELMNMRDELHSVKEELSDVKLELATRNREAEREILHLREELQDRQDRYLGMEDELRQAQEGQEHHRGKAADHWSRAQAYLNEVEGLKIREAELRAKISALEAQSSRDSLAHSELTRRLSAVMQDRDMLSNALDSKDFELELLRRGQAQAQSRKRGVVSQLSPSPKGKIKLRVRNSSSPAEVLSSGAVQQTPTPNVHSTPAALAPTAKHNAISSRGSASSIRGAAEQADAKTKDKDMDKSDRPLMVRHPLRQESNRRMSSSPLPPWTRQLSTASASASARGVRDSADAHNQALSTSRDASSRSSSSRSGIPTPVRRASDQNIALAANANTHDYRSPSPGALSLADPPSPPTALSAATGRTTGQDSTTTRGSGSRNSRASSSIRSTMTPSMRGSVSSLGTLAGRFQTISLE